MENTKYFIENYHTSSRTKFRCRCIRVMVGLGVRNTRNLLT